MSLDDLLKQSQSGDPNTIQTVSPGPTASGPPPIGLDRLLRESAAQQNTPPDPTKTARTQQLLGVLSGRTEIEDVGGGLTGAVVTGTKRVFENINARRELGELGLDDKQIDIATKTLRKLQTPIRLGQLAGGIVGGIAGAATFGPDPTDIVTVPALAAGTAKFVGAALGAGAVGVAGETAQIGLEENRLISKTEALRSFGEEAGLEAATRGAVSFGKFLFSPFIKQTVPEAAALVDEFAKFGGSFSPIELDNRLSLSLAESISKGSFGAAEIFRDFELKQNRAALSFADSVVDSIAQGVSRQTSTQLGESLAQDISRPGGRIFALMDDVFDPLYKKIQQLAPDATVNTSAVKQFAGNQLKKDAKLSKNFLSPAGRERMKNIVGLPGTLSIDDMRTLRTSILQEARKLGRDVDPSEALVKQLAGLTQESIESPVLTKQLSGEALNLLTNTNRLYAASRQGLATTFSEKLAKRLIAKPSNVLREVFPNDNAPAIKRMRQALIEPVSGKTSKEGKLLWDSLRKQWAGAAVEDATKEGVFNVSRFSATLSRMKPESLNVMFSKEELNRLKKVTSLFETVKKKPLGQGALFVKGIQFFGAAKLYQGIQEGDALAIAEGGALAIGPVAYAKLATDKIGAKLLTTGLKLKPGSTALVPIVTRMIKILSQISERESTLGKQRKQTSIPTPSLKELRGFGGRGF